MFQQIEAAPIFEGKIKGGWTMTAEPRRVASTLRQIGYDWQPGVRLLVHLRNNRPENVLAFFGSTKHFDPAAQKVYKLK